MVRSIGADRVIDYTQEDFTKSGQRYDLILDSVGNHSIFACRRVMNPKGSYVKVGGPDGRWIGPLAGFFTMLMVSPFVSQHFAMLLAGPASKEDRILLHDLLEAGKVKPVIDRRYSLSDVPEAIRYLEGGHARGKVVISPI